MPLKWIGLANPQYNYHGELMAIPKFTEETSLYEILIRTSPDGSWAAHYQNITVVAKDGVPISAVPSEIMPLSLGDPAAVAIVEGLIGVAGVKNMQVVEQLKSDIERYHVEIDALRAEVESWRRKEEERNA